VTGEEGCSGRRTAVLQCVDEPRRRAQVGEGCIDLDSPDAPRCGRPQ
jgi:hypothetical protein